MLDFSLNVHGIEWEADNCDQTLLCDTFNTNWQIVIELIGPIKNCAGTGIGCDYM